MNDGPFWQPWKLGAYSPDDCGGHSFMVHSHVQLNDLKKSAEKAYRSGGKWQVVHYHSRGEKCNEGCEAYGAEGEVPIRG